jgi:hypothetical protein
VIRVSTPGPGGGGYGYGPPPQRPPTESGGYAYSPYGAPFQGAPAARPSASTRATRPPILWIGLALVLLSAVPFLLAGVLLLVAQLNPNAVSPEFMTRITDAGYTLDQAVQGVRALGGVLAGLAAIYVLFAVLATVGRNWARIVLLLFTGLFAVSLLLALLVLGVAGDAATLAVIGGVLVLSVAGTVIFFLPPARQFYARRR